MGASVSVLILTGPSAAFEAVAHSLLLFMLPSLSFQAPHFLLVFLLAHWSQPFNLLCGFLLPLLKILLFEYPRTCTLALVFYQSIVSLLGSHPVSGL